MRGSGKGNEEPPCTFRGEVASSPKELMGETMEKQGDLVQGTLDMLVLKALARGAKHGYGVAEWIHEAYRFSQRSQHRNPLLGLIGESAGRSEARAGE